MLYISHVAEEYFKPNKGLETLLPAVLASEVQHPQDTEAAVRLAEHRLLPLERFNNFRGFHGLYNRFPASSLLFRSRTVFLVVNNNHVLLVQLILFKDSSIINTEVTDLDYIQFRPSTRLILLYHETHITFEGLGRGRCLSAEQSRNPKPHPAVPVNPAQGTSRSTSITRGRFLANMWPSRKEESKLRPQCHDQMPVEREQRHPEGKLLRPIGYN